MNDEFDQSVDEIREQLTVLYRKILQSPHAPNDAINEAYEALSVLVEELHQADNQISLNYEELLQTRQNLEEERARYQELFEFAPDAYLVTNVYGTIEDANRAAAAMLNVRRDFLIKKPLNLFIDHKNWKKFFKLENQAKQVNDFELAIQPRNSNPLIVAVKLAVVYNALRQPVAFRWMLRDITGQKRSQIALTASESRFRTIFQGVNMGMVLTDLNNGIIETNSAFETMMGYEKDTLLGKDFSIFSVASEPLIEAEPLKALLLEKGERYHAEKPLLRKDAEILWVHLIVSLLYVTERRPQSLLYMVEDITNEKLTADELTEMNHRLQNSSEIERLYLAQELHDGPMQDLYGAIFKLSASDGQTGPDELGDNIKNVQGILEGVIGTLRTICGELRPPTLENFGLETAIRSHAEKLQEQHPEIEIQLDLQRDEQELSKEIRISLFRIYQQTIMNVIRHAQAQQVEVQLHLEEHTVILSVQDNGKGFSLPENWLEFLRQGRYGLAGIAERVDTLGGELSIQTDLHTGTHIQVSVPR